MVYIFSSGRVFYLLPEKGFSMMVIPVDTLSAGSPEISREAEFKTDDRGHTFQAG